MILLNKLSVFIILFNINQLYSQENERLFILNNLKNWAKGKSDSIYFFKSKEFPKITNALKDAYQVRRCREFWYNKNLDMFKNGSQNWLEVTNFSGRFQTFRGVLRAKMDFFEQTIGGFTVHVYPIKKDSIKFIVYDIKSRWSLFYHLPFIQNVQYNNLISKQKPMTNMIWWFEWTESIKTSLFYQRLYNQQFIKKKYSGHYF